MKLFKVYIKDSHSRHWMVDTKGLANVKKHYENYPSKDKMSTINRWPEFTVEPIDRIWFDFGGMMSANDPTIQIPVGDKHCDVHLSHLPTLIEALSSPKYEDKKLWSITAWHWCYVLSDASKKKLLASAKKQFELHKETYEANERKFTEDIAKINEKGLLIVRQKHDGG